MLGRSGAVYTRTGLLPQSDKRASLNVSNSYQEFKKLGMMEPMAEFLMWIKWND
jgi:hypothetical protein